MFGPSQGNREGKDRFIGMNPIRGRTTTSGRDRVDPHWSELEFADLDFGDKRLDRRFRKTAQRLSEQPMASINQACEGWAETKGAYRLFDNDKADRKKILAAHQRRTQERIQAKKLSRILLIQDTSFLNYTEHFKTLGLGPIGCVNKHKKTKADSKGLIVHTAMALSLDGLPLGILSQNIWAREPESERPKWRKKASRKRVPIEQKESYKWLKTLDEVVPWIPEGVQAITVADRECDLFEFVARAEKLKTHYTIRSAWDRAVMVEHEAYYLWDYLSTLDTVGTYEVEVEAPRVAKQKVAAKRTAVLEVRFAKVELRRPPKKKVDRTECFAFLPTYAVWAKEVDAPEGVEPLEWMLLTNVPVESFEEAKERLSWYKLRWHIENFHKVLKSGLKVELCRLEAIDRLERYVTTCSIVAWHLYWLTHASRVDPEGCCIQVLADHEWKALYCRIHKTSHPPKEPPTTREAIRWIASLGGFLGRKGDGEPGIITLWRGWQRLTDISDDWLLFHPQTCG